VISLRELLGFLSDPRNQAAEALFCTFDADLGWFEQTVLGVARSAGARVTVVADAGVSAPDPRAVLNAGTRYVHGLAVAGSGAGFHPKVTVIAGPERAMIAIGSGNLTPAGWRLNRETWTFITADREGCPAIVTDVAGWLRTLDRVRAISPLAVRGIERTAAQLDGLVAGGPVTGTGHRLVHTSAGPLIDQLPAGQVSHLFLYAPFLDEKAPAVRQLIERLRPGRVTLAVQSGRRTVIQPNAVQQIVADLRVPFEVAEDDGADYRHGGLIEAVGADGVRWTLTGSPDLSDRALLRSAEDGGHVVVGIVSRPGSGLFPAGRPVPLADVAAVRLPRPSARRAAAGVPLLAAVRTPNGLELVLAEPPAAPGRLLAADVDRWADVGAVPAGMVSDTVTGLNLPGGTPVRCSWDDGLGGIVFVTDPDLVLVRVGETRDAAGPADLIADPQLLERWLRALGEPAGPGTDMASFVLGGMPRLRQLDGSVDELLAPADRLISADRPAFDTDDETIVGDDTDPGTVPPPAVVVAEDEPAIAEERVLTDAERRRVRRELETAVTETMAGLPVLERLALFSLVLYAVQARVWEGHGWFPVVGDAIERIDKEDIPDQLSGTAASWAATAVYLMHEHRPTSGRPAEVLLYEKAAARVSHLFPEADAQMVADLVVPFTNKNGYPVDPSAVMDLIGMVVQEDPLAEAIDVLEGSHPAWDVHKHNDSLLHIDGEFRGTFLPAAEALDAIPGNGLGAVWATGKTSGWTMVIRDADSLIRIERNPQGQITWWHYRLNSLSKPTSIARDPELGNRARVRHGALNQPFPEAIQAMTAVGATPDDPPTECPEDG
jgi:hypothetical protein